MKIPFTTEQFFEVIVNYNTSLFPAQLFILILGIIAALLIFSKRSLKNQLIGGLLGFIWIWTGIVYHISFFTTINKAAYGFGTIFILQGLFFFIETFSRKKLVFEFSSRFIDYLAYFFIWFGLVLYPILIYLIEGSVNQIITLGLPCPTTILTFGFLMLTQKKLSKYLIIIPFIWAIIGTGAAINFGVYPDYFMLISAIIGGIYLVARKK